MKEYDPKERLHDVIHVPPPYGEPLSKGTVKKVYRDTKRMVWKGLPNKDE